MIGMEYPTAEEHLAAVHNCKRYPSGQVFPYSDFFLQQKVDGFYIEWVHYSGTFQCLSLWMLQLRTNDPLVVFQIHQLEPDFYKSVAKGVSYYVELCRKIFALCDCQSVE